MKIKKKFLGICCKILEHVPIHRVLDNEKNDSQLKKSKLYHLYFSIKKSYKNHAIHFITMIEQHPRGHQSMLENVADYLVEGKWWSETNNGVVFFDLEKNDTLKNYPTSDPLQSPKTINIQHVGSNALKIFIKYLH